MMEESELFHKFTKVEFMDLETGNSVGNGITSERYFTRNRVMGVVVFRPLYWDPLAIQRA